MTAVNVLAPGTQRLISWMWGGTRFRFRPFFRRINYGFFPNRAESGVSTGIKLTDLTSIFGNA